MLIHNLQGIFILITACIYKPESREQFVKLAAYTSGPIIGLLTQAIYRSIVDLLLSSAVSKAPLGRRGRKHFNRYRGWVASIMSLAGWIGGGVSICTVGDLLVLGMYHTSSPLSL